MDVVKHIYEGRVVHDKLLPEKVANGRELKKDESVGGAEEIVVKFV